MTGLRAGVAATAGSSSRCALGSPTGGSLATVHGDRHRRRLPVGHGTAPVSGAAGRHDLYLVFKGDLRIKDLAFTR